MRSLPNNQILQSDIPPRPVLITWLDAFAGPQGWTYLSEYTPEPAKPHTVGWLLPDHLEGYYTTADTYLVSGDSFLYYNIGHIPIGMVESLTYLDEPPKKVTKTRTR